MNLALSDEQVFLREAARGALSRFKTLEAAREALDGDERRCPTCGRPPCEAGWPGLLIDEAHGGAGLDAFDAMLVLGECGRVLAGVAAARPPARDRDPERLRRARCRRAAAPRWRRGERRAAYLPARPPNDLFDELERRPAPRACERAPRRRWPAPRTRPT